MTVRLEPVSMDHFQAATLRSMIPSDARQGLVDLERNGGIAQAVIKDDEVVGLIMVSPDHEVSISVHSTHQRRGIGTEAFRLLAPIARQRSIVAVKCVK